LELLEVVENEEYLISEIKLKGINLTDNFGGEFVERLKGSLLEYKKEDWFNI